MITIFYPYHLSRLEGMDVTPYRICVEDWGWYLSVWILKAAKSIKAGATLYKNSRNGMPVPLHGKDRKKFLSYDQTKKRFIHCHIHTVRSDILKQT